MRLCLVLLVLAAAGAALAQPVPQLSFEVAGQPPRSLDLPALQHFAQQAVVNVYEPHERHAQQYLAMPLTPILDGVYGPAWREQGAVLFTCADGYKAPVPVDKLQHYRAYLAHARPGGSTFELHNVEEGGKLVPLAPYYLVWDNLSDPELQAAGGQDWPYQIVSVQLVDIATHYPRIVPPADAPAQVQRGFTAFRRHCLACHGINGQGGEKAPELNFPVSVTELWRDGWLQRWMLDPASIRYNTPMPGLSKALPDREQLASDILAYLQSMAQHKQPPPAP